MRKWPSGAGAGSEATEPRSVILSLTWRSDPILSISLREFFLQEPPGGNATRRGILFSGNKKPRQGWAGVLSGRIFGTGKMPVI